MWAGAGDLGTGCHGGGGGRRDCSRQPQLLKLSASPAAPRCAAQHRRQFPARRPLLFSSTNAVPDLEVFRLLGEHSLCRNVGAPHSHNCRTPIAQHSIVSLPSARHWLVKTGKRAVDQLIYFHRQYD